MGRTPVEEDRSIRATTTLVERAQAGQRERFIRNCQLHSKTLARLMTELGSEYPLIFGFDARAATSVRGQVTGKHPTEQDWLAFFQDPVYLDCDVSHVLFRRELLSISEDELVRRITMVHSYLYPLILLSIKEDPMPDILDYLSLDVDEQDDEDVGELHPPYSLSALAQDTGLGIGALQDWVEAIRRKGQAILYGPPGTGKTYSAEKLAAHLVTEGDGIVELVQFHPSYTYEEFIQGIRPRSNSDGILTYPLVPGRFLEFCAGAEQRQGTSVLIIDEINRANLARVFGELMYLLEYRDKAIPLAGGEKQLDTTASLHYRYDEHSRSLDCTGRPCLAASVRLPSTAT